VLKLVGKFRVAQLDKKWNPKFIAVVTEAES
jgi:hypothetical protein